MNRFYSAYERTPPWEIGRPQPAVVELEQRGLLRSEILDAGCGTGENSMFLASCGYYVTGVDVVPFAIQQANSKALERKIPVPFLIHDALELPALEMKFDTVLDAGMFHVFDDADREKYVQGLHEILQPGGCLYIICFSELEPAGWGPRRVRQDEIHAAFTSGWTVETIEPSVYQTLRRMDPIPAWLAAIRRN